MKKNIFNKIIRGDGQEKELPLTRRKQILSIVKDMVITKLRVW